MRTRSSSASRIRACFALDASETLRFKVFEGGGTFDGGTSRERSPSSSEEGIGSGTSPPTSSSVPSVVLSSSRSGAWASSRALVPSPAFMGLAAFVCSGRATAIRALRVVQAEAERLARGMLFSMGSPDWDRRSPPPSIRAIVPSRSELRRADLESKRLPPARPISRCGQASRCSWIARSLSG